MPKGHYVSLPIPRAAVLVPFAPGSLVYLAAAPGPLGVVQAFLRGFVVVRWNPPLHCTGRHRPSQLVLAAGPNESGEENPDGQE
jgi:hypothetical protein